MTEKRHALRPSAHHLQLTRRELIRLVRRGKVRFERCSMELTFTADDLERLVRTWCLDCGEAVRPIEPGVFLCDGCKSTFSREVGFVFIPESFLDLPAARFALEALREQDVDDDTAAARLRVALGFPDLRSGYLLWFAFRYPERAPTHRQGLSPLAEEA